MDPSAPISPRILSGYGLVEAPFERAVSELSRRARGAASKIALASSSAGAAAALTYLDVRTWPATRLVIVDQGAWCAVLTNSRNGSDFNDHQRWATDALQTRTLRVVDREARIIVLCAADGSVLRSIACMNDGGRQVFETYGQPLPVESGFDYGAKRKADRFTGDNLHALLRSLGAEPLSLDSFRAAPRFALLSETPANKDVRRDVERFACSAAEADDPAFLHYVSGMHAADRMDLFGADRVVSSLERAIQLNPAYEPRVRKVLEKARRRAGGR